MVKEFGDIVFNLPKLKTWVLIRKDNFACYISTRPGYNLKICFPKPFVLQMR